MSGVQSILLALRPRIGSWQHLDGSTTNTLLGLRELVCLAEVSQAFPVLQAGRFALYHCLRALEVAPLRCVTVAVYRVSTQREGWSELGGMRGVMRDHVVGR